MNEADSRHLSAQLESLGYSACSEAEQADLVVLNTCVVRQQAEDKAVGRLTSLQRVKERRPEMTIGLMGCFVGVREAPRLRKRYPFVDVFMPPSDTTPLLDHLDHAGAYDPGRMIETREKALRDAIQDGDYLLPSAGRGTTVAANVPVVLGCSHNCSFCIIPARRGGERSRPPEEIEREVIKLIGQGVKEVTLLGQIVDRYGMDMGWEVDLAGLLRRIADLPGLERLRFLTSHPSWMTDAIIDAVAGHPKICPQLEVPIQAGDDEVLERMRRGYTVEEYVRICGKIRARIPDAAIHTDVIVGFPGETAAQFEGTYRVLEELRLDKAHIAKYSERPRTIAAAKYADDVLAEEKERRRKALDQLQTGILAEKMVALEGHTVDVLVDGFDAKTGRWRGRTPQSKLVFFEDPRDLLGERVDVLVERTGPFSLIGRAADARHASVGR
jgi:tRNA-2-methylthio-N6-dimethylallyladenosine synthase